MQKLLQTLILLCILICPLLLVSQNDPGTGNENKLPEGYQLKTQIDNQGYWLRMAGYGLTKLNPYVIPEPAQYKGSGMT